MLNEPITEEQSQQEAGEGTAPAEGDGQGQAGSGVNYIRVTPHEKEAIERVSLNRLFYCMLQCIYWESVFDPIVVVTTQSNVSWLVSVVGWLSLVHICRE